MRIYVKNSFDFHIVLVFNHDFVIYIDFTRVATQTPQLMTSQIRSPIEYLIQTYNILLLICSCLYSKLMRNVAALAVLIRLNDDSW